MNLQPLLALLTGRGGLHGFTHTWIGAGLLTVPAALVGKYLGELALYLLGLRRQRSICWSAAWLGIGIHVLLDGLVHTDVRLFVPLSAANGLFGRLSWKAMEWLCLACGALGSVRYLAVACRPAKRRPAQRDTDPV